MKRVLMTIGLSLALAAPTFAQKPMDQQNEKNVQITQGPNITGITGTSANIQWTTNSAGANHVRYRLAGTGDWKSAYAPGGGTSHSIQLTGLTPGQVYEWQILTRDGDLRTAGQFQSAATATGTAPDVNAGTAPPATGAPAPGASAGAKVPLYRAVSTAVGGHHLYTTSSAEQTSQAWKPEGIAGYLMTSQGPGTTALYRLTNAKGDYALTTDVNSRAALLSQGYRDEGVIGYIAQSPVPGTEPLFGTVSADGTSHFYTTGAAERDQVVSRGFQNQGINGYIWTQP
jgi:hypothetical protein